MPNSKRINWAKLSNHQREILLRRCAETLYSPDPAKDKEGQDLLIDVPYWRARYWAISRAARRHAGECLAGDFLGSDSKLMKRAKWAYWNAIALHKGWTRAFSKPNEIIRSDIISA